MGIIDLVFPKNCLGCGAGGSYLCMNCTKKHLSPKLKCPICDRPSVDGMTHLRCKKKLGLDGAVSVFVYSGVIRTVIMKLKYSYAKEMAKDLASAVIYKINDSNMDVAIPNPSVLTPVPLFWYRKNYRGFNQSGEVGRLVSEKLQFKFVDDLIERKKGGKSQTELKGKERRKNIKDAFSFNRKYDIKGTNIVIFDDVYTTGSTIKEACKVLKRSGAGGVWGLTIAS